MPPLLPRAIGDTLHELSEDATYLTRVVDLTIWFWHVRLREEDTHKAALQTPNGRMERVVMLFGLFTPLPTSQSMMNDIMTDFPLHFAIVYRDDVCMDMQSFPREAHGKFVY
jgi:hypothetical protein